MNTSIFRHIFALAATAVAATASAQSLTEALTVQGRYTPEIIPADRLALLPSAMALTAPESPMAYDRRGVVASFRPDALSMPATGWRARKAYDTSKGYLDLRLGSWLNSSLSAGYTAINDEDTRLNVWLQHNSTSLWQAWKEDKETGMPGADRRFRYDETLGADISHGVFGKGTLKAGLEYHLGYFNYYGTDRGTEKDGHLEAPTQTLNDIHACVGWTGANYGQLAYSVDADVRYFGYRAMYLPRPLESSLGGYAKTKGDRETAVNVGGDVKYSLNDASGNGSAIGIGLRYSGVLNSIGNDVNRVEATPAYTLTGRNYTLRLGANLAVVGNGERTRFRVAPDVSFTARKGLAAFSAAIGGGTYLRTLAWHHTMDYYSDPTAGCYQAAYSPLDIRLALQFNPGGSWTFGVEGLWNTTLDESFGGLYQTLLNDFTYAMYSSAMYPGLYYGDSWSYSAYPASGRIHGFSIAVNAGYEFSRYFALKGKASWQPQDGSKGILNGFDRPAFTADLTAESNPTDKLSLRLDYRLRAKRDLLPGSLSLFGLSADYRITDKVSVGVELDNILNRHQEFLPGLPMEGINAMGGVQIVF